MRSDERRRTLRTADPPCDRGLRQEVQLGQQRPGVARRNEHWLRTERQSANRWRHERHGGREQHELRWHGVRSEGGRREREDREQRGRCCREDSSQGYEENGDHEEV